MKNTKLYLPRLAEIFKKINITHYSRFVVIGDVIDMQVSYKTSLAPGDSSRFM